jgi:hypothetical protein
MGQQQTSGDLALAPEPKAYPDTRWHMGEPDLIARFAARKLPATGVIPSLRHLPYLFEHDTWVQGIEIMPGNPKVVHHANLGFATLPVGFDEARNFLTGKVPGGIAVDLDSGVAMMIPKGSGLVFQIHYVTTGKEETDQISVGCVSPKSPSTSVFVKNHRRLPILDSAGRATNAWPPKAWKKTPPAWPVQHMHLREGLDLLCPLPGWQNRDSPGAP